MNRYDDVHLYVATLLKQQDASLAPADPSARRGDGLGALGRLGGFARLYALGALVKLAWHRRLIYANLRLDWFFEFQRYWVQSWATASSTRTTSTSSLESTGTGCTAKPLNYLPSSAGNSPWINDSQPTAIAANEPHPPSGLHSQRAHARTRRRQWEPCETLSEGVEPDDSVASELAHPDGTRAVNHHGIRA